MVFWFKDGLRGEELPAATTGYSEEGGVLVEEERVKFQRQGNLSLENIGSPTTSHYNQYIAEQPTKVEKK